MTINSQGITEYAGAIVTQGSATGVLKTAVSNYWTVGLTTGQTLEEGAGALVTQGSNTGKLRKSLSGTVATFQITAASGVSFDDTSDMLIGTTAVIGSNIASGTVLNTGAATSIIIVANSGATFVHTTAAIVIGTTPVAGADITAAVLSGTTSSFVVQAASGSVLDVSTTITVGGASINGAAIDTVTPTQATSTGYIHIELTGASTNTISIRSQWGVVFHTLTNVVIGETAGAGGITTLAAGDVTAAVLSTNIDISKISLRNSTEAANNAIVLTDVDNFYGVASATTPSLTLVDSHPHLGLSFTILLTEELRIRAIEASGTPGGDFHPLTLDVSLGAVKDLAGNNNVAIGDGASKEIVVVETADTTKPIVISARVDLDSRILRINADETLKNTFASHALKKFDFTKFFFSNTPGAKDSVIGSSGSIVNTDTHTSDGLAIHPDATFLNVTFTDNLKLAITVFSGVPGGDGTAMYLDIEAGAIEDIAGNKNAEQLGILLAESPDISPPVVLSANLYLGTGIITISFDETVDLTPISELNVSAFYISNNPRDFYLNLGNDASQSSEIANGLPFDIVKGDVLIDGLTVNISIPEAQRVLLIQRSGQPGGDGQALTLDSFPTAVHDIGQLYSVYQSGITIFEFPDLIAPVIVSASLDLTNGVMILTSEEILDLTPSTKINSSAINVKENSDVGDYTSSTTIWVFTINLRTLEQPLGETVVQGSNTGVIRVKLTGDTTDTVVITAASDQTFSTTDDLVIGTNNIQKETISAADIKSASPRVWTVTINSAEINEAQGVVVTQGTGPGSVGTLRLALTGAGTTSVEINADGAYGAGTEFGPSTTEDLIIGNTRVNAEDILFADSTAFLPRVRLHGATVDTNAVDSLVFTVVLSEAERVRAIENSARSGSLAQQDVYSLWTLSVTNALYSVAQGETVTQSASQGKLFEAIGNEWTLTINTATLDEDQGCTVTQGSATGRLKVALFGSSTIVRILATPGNVFVHTSTDLLVGTTLINAADVTDAVQEPTSTILVSSALGVTFDHTSADDLDVGGTIINAAQFTGSSVIVTAAPSIVHIDNALVLDMAQAPNVFTTLTVEEFADIEEPRLTSAIVNYGTGIINLTFSETIDSNPLSLVNLNKVYLANVADGEDVKLLTYDGGYLGGTGAVTFPQGPQQLPTVQLQLSEAQRVAGLLISGTVGGDGVAAMFHVDETFAFRDVATNSLQPNLLDAFTMTEQDDIINPTVDAAAVFLNLSDGTVRITSSETLDCTSSDVGGANGVYDLSKLSLSQTSGDWDEPGTGVAGDTIPLTLSQTLVVPLGLLYPIIEFTLVESDRILAIERSGDNTKGGDGVGLVMDALAGAFQDVGQNPSIAVAGVTVVEVVDSVPIRLTAATIDLGTGVVTVSASEYFHKTLDLSKHNLHHFFITNDPATGYTALPFNTTAPQVDATLNCLAGGSTLTSVSTTVLTFTLSENQRSAAIAASNTPGGDGSATALVVRQSGTQDVANNPNIENFVLVLTETADTTDPQITNVFMDMSTGTITITFSENMDLSPLASNVRLSKIRISNVPDGTYTVNRWKISVTNPQQFNAIYGASVSQTVTGGATYTGTVMEASSGLKTFLYVQAATDQLFDLTADFAIVGGQPILQANLDTVSYLPIADPINYPGEVVPFHYLTNANYNDGNIIHHTIQERAIENDGVNFTFQVSEPQRIAILRLRYVVLSL